MLSAELHGCVVLEKGERIWLGLCENILTPQKDLPSDCLLSTPTLAALGWAASRPSARCYSRRTRLLFKGGHTSLTLADSAPISPLTNAQASHLIGGSVFLKSLFKEDESVHLEELTFGQSGSG